MRKAVLHLKKSDPVMRGIVERIGACKMQFGEPTFHSLAEAIVYQQLNGKAAVTMYKRYLEKRAARNGSGRVGHGKKSQQLKPKKVKIVLPTPDQMQKIAKRWEPYRSIACWYLWQSLDRKTLG